MTLSRVERRWAAAAIGAIFPGSRDEGLADIAGMDVDGFLGELLGHLPWRAAFGLRLAAWLVALAPLLVLRRLSTISGLAAGDRERVVARLVSSRWYAVRALVLVLKTVGALLYAGDDRVRTRMMPPRSQIVILRDKRVHAA